jgi:hypothetical protein
MGLPQEYRQIGEEGRYYYREKYLCDELCIERVE